MFEPPKPKTEKQREAQLQAETAQATVVALIDKACQSLNAQQTPRTYLGASRWGETCERKLRFEYEHAPTDKEHKFEGKIIRIFDMGHDAEPRLEKYMRAAGFTIVTHSVVTGGQIGFSIMDGKLSGHIDGYITDGPDIPGVKYPMLWENKALNDKSWNDTLSKGVKDSKPVYYSQMQTYCAYLDIENGSMFTAINRNTGEVLVEFVPYDARNAQESSDRALRVINASDAKDLSRAGKVKTDFACKFCDYKKVCWTEAEAPAPARPAATTPGWLAQK